MCGIAGTLTRNAPPPSVGTMLECIRHRGPDDEGIWSAPEGGASFAHTRLSILDLSAAGKQPMSTPDGRLTITFNGEIYNFKALRSELEQRGVRFRTNTDTEVILRAYEAEGPACVARLRGMFAFALWDARDRSCLLARDQFGIKPLYFHQAADRLTFASEVKALIASPLVPRQLDEAALFGYFLTGSVPEPHSLLRGVSSLEPGSYAIWKDGGLSTHRYWQLRFAGAVPGGDAVAATREALRDSVEHHFVSDTPVGVFLSGGIDSTAIVAIATQVAGRDLQTFSLTFPGTRFDEGSLARRSAAHFGTTHSEWAVDAAIARPLFAQFLAASDLPSIDGLNTFAVSKLARERGMKVVLSGLGGDELFGGYKSFTQVPAITLWNRRLASAGPLRSIAASALQRVAGPRWRRIGDLAARPATLAETYVAFRGIFTRAEAALLVSHYTGTSVGNDGDPFAPIIPDHDPRDTISRLELTRFMRNQVLRDADTMSMAWGLELRVPFLDGPFVETITAIPAGVRLRAGKQLLLQAVPEIPEWVARQPKRGFMFPFSDWLDNDWRDVFAAIDRVTPVPTQNWYRKWCVFAIEQWMRKLGRSV